MSQCLALTWHTNLFGKNIEEIVDKDSSIGEGALSLPTAATIHLTPVGGSLRRLKGLVAERSLYLRWW
ncbi:MAG TPA: hypothetical protein V6D50_22240, partial [Chroococcales cyanobacterium]